MQQKNRNKDDREHQSWVRTGSARGRNHSIAENIALSLETLLATSLTTLPQMLPGGDVGSCVATMISPNARVLAAPCVGRALSLRRRSHTPPHSAAKVPATPSPAVG